MNGPQHKVYISDEVSQDPCRQTLPGSCRHSLDKEYSVSPDGSRIAFQHESDICVVEQVSQDAFVALEAALNSNFYRSSIKNIIHELAISDGSPQHKKYIKKLIQFLLQHGASTEEMRAQITKVSYASVFKDDAFRKKLLDLITLYEPT